MKGLKHFINERLYPKGTIDGLIVENSSYDNLAQVGYFIKDKYGQEEYEKLQDAGVISLQDGDTTINITTSTKPEGTNADSITKVLRGWLSSYKKYDGLKENVRAKTKMVQDFAQSLLTKYPIKDLKLFYYPESSTKDVIVINLIQVADNDKNSGIGTRIMNDIITFADNETFILTLTPSNKFGSSVKRLREFYKRFGFIKNTNKRFNEEMIRLPINGVNECMIYMTYSVNGNAFQQGEQSQNELKIKDTIQDSEYLEKWYEEFVAILNSPAYQERRYKESSGITVTRKKINKDDSRVGFAIVGSSKVV